MKKTISIIIMFTLMISLLACQVQVPQQEVVQPVEIPVIQPEPIVETPAVETSVVETPKEVVEETTVEQPKASPTPTPITEPKVEEEKLVEGKVIRKGQFRTQYTPGIAPTLGRAEIVEANGLYYVQFKGFSTGQAKKLHVYLAVDHGIRSAGDYNVGYIDVGEIKKFQGDQQYAMPADFIPNKWGSVSLFSQYNSAVHSVADLQ